MSAAEDHCCRALIQLLQTLDGQDAGAVERAIASHLTGCPLCAADERRLADLLARFREADSPDLPADLEARLLARLCAS
jgi:hypothetical protein